MLTMFDERTNLAQQVADELKKYFGEKLVPRRFRAISGWRRHLVMASRRCFTTCVRGGRQSYIRLAKELLERYAAERDAFVERLRLIYVNIDCYQYLLQSYKSDCRSESVLKTSLCSITAILPSARAITIGVPFALSGWACQGEMFPRCVPGSFAHLPFFIGARRACRINARSASPMLETSILCAYI